MKNIKNNTARTVEFPGSSALSDPTPIPFNRAVLVGDELNYIRDSVSSGAISGEGPFVKKCEGLLEKYLGHDCRVLLTPSCTAALEMTSLLLDLKPGDEVLVPSFTFVSTASAVALTGARPVFVDIDEETLNPNVSHLSAALTPSTRAASVIHYGGLPCNMDELSKFIADSNLVLIEDAAHALGSFYAGRSLGSFGTFSAFSFHETKNVTCGEGGALVVRGNVELYRKAQIIRDKGTNREAFKRGDAAFYTWVEIGSSFVMSDILAAFLYAQLQKLEEVTDARRKAKCYYEALLQPLREEGKLNFRIDGADVRSSAHLFYILLDSEKTREDLRKHLGRRGVSAVFHYQPLHKSPYIERRWGVQPSLPVTESVAGRLLRLPLFNSISQQEIEFVCDAVSEFFG